MREFVFMVCFAVVAIFIIVAFAVIIFLSGNWYLVSKVRKHMRLSRGTMLQDVSDDWLTPDWLLNKVRECFRGRIDLDPCGNRNDHVRARRRILPPTNGLEIPWRDKVFVNPPFGRSYDTKLEQWWHKAWVSKSVAQVLLLVPAWTDSTSFQFYAPKAGALCFIKGRVGFRRADGGEHSTSAASHLMAGYGVHWADFERAFAGVGWIVRPSQMRLQTHSMEV